MSWLGRTLDYLGERSHAPRIVVWGLVVAYLLDKWPSHFGNYAAGVAAVVLFAIFVRATLEIFNETIDEQWEDEAEINASKSEPDQDRTSKYDPGLPNVIAIPPSRDPPERG